MSRKLILVAALAVIVAVAALIFVARRQAAQSTTTAPVAAVTEDSRAPVAGHGVPPVAIKSATVAAPAAPKSNTVVAAAPANTGPDLAKIVANLTSQQAALLQQASVKLDAAKQDVDRKYNLPIENSLRWMDLAFHQRDLALNDDQLAKLDAIKQKINAQMEAAGIIALVDQTWALQGQANDAMKSIQPDMPQNQKDQIQAQATAYGNQAAQIWAQVTQAKAPFNQQYIDAARPVLTPAQNLALDKLLGTPTGPG